MRGSSGRSLLRTTKSAASGGDAGGCESVADVADVADVDAGGILCHGGVFGGGADGAGAHSTAPACTAVVAPRPRPHPRAPGVTRGPLSQAPPADSEPSKATPTPWSALWLATGRRTRCAARPALAVCPAGQTAGRTARALDPLPAAEATAEAEATGFWLPPLASSAFHSP